jgi:hypothetical protein
MLFPMAVFISGTITGAVAFTIHVSFTRVISIGLLMAHLIFAGHQLHFSLHASAGLLHLGIDNLGDFACLYSSTG